MSDVKKSKMGTMEEIPKNEFAIITFGLLKHTNRKPVSKVPDWHLMQNTDETLT